MNNILAFQAETYIYIIFPMRNVTLYVTAAFSGFNLYA